MAINIVLIEPEIPQNTGNIIRTCACLEARLHLIRPLGFSMTEKQLRRAGLDYIDLVEIKYYDNFQEFEQTYPKGDFWLFSTKSTRNHYEGDFEDECFLIFGKESKGIDDEILKKYKERMLRIPMRNQERLRSLNLSNSVAVAAYESIRKGFLKNLK
ncbi:MAG: tRNA (cytidine(34)-2'-O)-methyltransferase [Filifactoraceae bacterium]